MLFGIIRSITKKIAISRGGNQNVQINRGVEVKFSDLTWGDQTPTDTMVAS